MKQQPATEFREVREPSLADQVYDTLLQRIVDGQYSRNDRLPSESDLAREHGVSRPVIRAALARLRNDEIIASRRGSGSFVQRRPNPSVIRFVPLGSITGIQQCYEFRIDVEGAAAAWAARRREEADLAAIELAYRLLDTRYAERNSGVDADWQFHLAIARATHNPYFLTVQNALAEQIGFGMNLSRSLSMLLSETRQQLVQAEHRAILDAIRAQDPQAASAAMRHHIAAARNRMFDGEGGEPAEPPAAPGQS